MERRTFLLGSGVVFATALAGCSETSSEGTTDDGGENGDEKRENGHVDDVDGFDEETLEEYGLAVEYVIHEESELDVGVTLTEEVKADLMDDEKREHVGHLADAMAEAVEDHEELEEEINSITMSVYNSSEVLILSLYANVAWILAYADEDMTDDEFAEKVLSEST